MNYIFMCFITCIWHLARLLTEHNNRIKSNYNYVQNIYTDRSKSKGRSRSSTNFVDRQPRKNSLTKNFLVCFFFFILNAVFLYWCTKYEIPNVDSPNLRWNDLRLILMGILHTLLESFNEHFKWFLVENGFANGWTTTVPPLYPYQYSFILNNSSNWSSTCFCVFHIQTKNRNWYLSHGIHRWISFIFFSVSIFYSMKDIQSTIEFKFMKILEWIHLQRTIHRFTANGFNVKCIRYCVHCTHNVR